MADYWKSTPKYWCKHCQVYVPDTKLQRANHESTGKHQSAVRRALRNLHRDHERQERQKDEAEREVARINALVAGNEATTGGISGKTDQNRLTGPPKPKQSTQPTQLPQASSAARREQMEQLADLGISIPESFRPELAMAGDWTVTETRIVEVQEEGGDAVKGEATRSVGVRKRPRVNPDDNDDEGRANHEGDVSNFENGLDAAVQGLFKRPRQWGRGAAAAGGSGGASNDAGDLDSLLSKAVEKPAAATKKEAAQKTKREPHDDIKKEDLSSALNENAAQSVPVPLSIKQEPDTENSSGLMSADDNGTPSSEPAIMFKRRKAKPGRK
ncbi:hypothetical protein SEPCBS119000_002546 [Sporothrix epigloea]|uniref:U1-type domain-containing protein n=1 Tax=Sporothrix epigloea TaxID=1892477 RepID=A0ABP0DI19_9PEZI